MEACRIPDGRMREIHLQTPQATEGYWREGGGETKRSIYQLEAGSQSKGGLYMYSGARDCALPILKPVA